MDNAPALMILLLTLPALIGAAVVSANAKKMNAAHRAAREAKAHAKAPAAH